MSVVECGYQSGHFHLYLVKCHGVAASQLISQLFHGRVKLILSAKSAIGIGMYLLQLTEEIVVILKQTVLFGDIAVCSLESQCTCEGRKKQSYCYYCFLFILYVFYMNYSVNNPISIRLPSGSAT